MVLDTLPAISARKGADLFIGIYPGGVVYADSSREVHGDYERVAFLPYGNLLLKWDREKLRQWERRPGSRPLALCAEIESHVLSMMARRGEDFPISGCGQTVRLGSDNPDWSLYRVRDLVGLDLGGVTADIRSRNADGSLRFPLLESQRDPILVQMSRVEMRKEPVGSNGPAVDWYYLSWAPGQYSCGYGGTTADSEELDPRYLWMQTPKPDARYIIGIDHPKPIAREWFFSGFRESDGVVLYEYDGHKGRVMSWGDAMQAARKVREYYRRFPITGQGITVRLIEVDTVYPSA